MDRQSRVSVNSNDGDDTYVGKRESRMSRNSTGFKEEFLTVREDEVQPTVVEEFKKPGGGRELMIVFILMVFVGLVSFTLYFFALNSFFVFCTGK